ncbi:MAG TPA: hypothetical protein VF018_03180 [Acidobacteriaceae bacterium]
MPTYYKPTQWRGKRVAYRSIDPAGPKTEASKVIRFMIGGVLFMASVWFLSKFST